MAEAAGGKRIEIGAAVWWVGPRSKRLYTGIVVGVAPRRRKTLENSWLVRPANWTDKARSAAVAESKLTLITNSEVQ